jgi:lactoylglutathione lyase
MQRREVRYMKVSELHHIAISVSDLDRSLHFYTRLLGLRQTLTMPVGGPATEAGLRLRPGTTGRSAYVQGPTRVGQLELIEWHDHGRGPTTPRRPGAPGPFLLAFELLEGDMRSAHERLLGAGVECWTEPRRSLVENYGTIEMLVCEDPDGLMIELLRLPSDEEVRRYRNAAGIGGRDGGDR